MNEKYLVKADEPLSKQVLEFIDAYLHLRDLEKAAVAVKLNPVDGKRLYKNRIVKAEIDRRMDEVNKEKSKIIAKKQVVTVDKLDKALMQVVNLPTEALKKAPALASAKVNSIELGYRRAGILIDDNFIPDNPGGTAEAARDDSAPIFRTTNRTILTHQVTRQQVVETTSDAPPAAAPITIDMDLF